MPSCNRKDIFDNMALLSGDDLRKQESLLLPVRSTKYQVYENNKLPFRGNVQQLCRKL